MFLAFPVYIIKSDSFVCYTLSLIDRQLRFQFIDAVTYDDEFSSNKMICAKIHDDMIPTKSYPIFHLKGFRRIKHYLRAVNIVGKPK